MLTLNNLSFDYHDRPLLNNIQFSLKKGELLHLKGANGSGKTTLIRLISGLNYPNSGDIYFDGQSIFQNLPEYQKNICYVGHRSGINPVLTLKQNLHFDLQYQHQDIIELASIFSIQHLVDTPVAYLSAGQRRQVGLLRLWMTDKKLWLLDEPLVALDEPALNILAAKMRQHCQQGGMILLTSHQKLPALLGDYREYYLS